MTSVTDAVAHPADTAPSPADAVPSRADAAPGPAKQQRLLPTKTPLALLGPDGRPVHSSDLDMPADDVLAGLHRQMVLGRRFDTQATALTKQGRLAVYPSGAGPGGVRDRRGGRAAPAGLAVPDLPRLDGAGRPRRRPGRGADPAARGLALRLRPVRAPGRPAVHAAGHQRAARRRDGPRRPAARARTPSPWSCSATARPARATSTRRSTSPRSGARRSCSSCRTTGTRSASRSPSRPPPRRWPTRGSATGCPGMLVDGNDPAAVYAARPQAVERARRGGGPTLDRGASPTGWKRTPTPTTPPATGPRPRCSTWRDRDPVTRIRQYLRGRGLLRRRCRSPPWTPRPRRTAEDLRRRMNADPVPDPADLFRYVYAEPTPQLREQQRAAGGRAGGTADEAGEMR